MSQKKDPKMVSYLKVAPLPASDELMGNTNAPDAEPVTDGKQANTLLRSLHRFTQNIPSFGLGGLAVEVKNPMARKYGKAYDSLIEGDLHFSQENYDKAIAAYQEAIALRSDCAEAHHNLGRCYRRKGNTDEALKALHHAVSEQPFMKDALIDLAKCYNDAGSIELSIRYFERAVRIAPTCLEAKFGLALVLELNQDLDYAAALYQDVLVLDSDFLPAYNNLGSVYLRVNRYEEAEALFKQLINKAPDFSRGYLGLALTLDKAGKWNDALTAYHDVLRIKPNSRNTTYINNRILEISKALGRTKSNRHTTLTLIK